jgi:hypothetical protein
MSTRRCLNCGFKGNEIRFTIGHNGVRQNYCKQCTAERKARYYAQNSEYRDRERDRVREYHRRAAAQKARGNNATR